MIKRAFRRQLSYKLFVSYIIVLLVGLTVMIGAVRVAGLAFAQRRFMMNPAMMNEMMGETRPGIQPRNGGGQHILEDFRSVLNETLALAGLTAGITAIISSILVSRQVTGPVREMMSASQRIAEGHYSERVNLRGNPEEGDLDELGELALHFNQMAEKLEDIEGTRRQLIGDVAHELRTPLTTIKGSMEGLIDGVLPPSEETFQRIYQEAGRLEQLVSDLQELSRVEAKAYELHLQPVRVEGMVDTALERMQPLLEEKDIRVEILIPGNLPLVMADENRIGQVLINLLGNAQKFTPRGGKVTIQAAYEEGSVRISILDNGSGIPPEELGRIFDRFYRVDKSRSRAYGGSGIGLTIARYLVEAHGGSIRAHSEGEGMGSEFSFSLPAAGMQDAA